MHFDAILAFCVTVPPKIVVIFVILHRLACAIRGFPHAADGDPHLGGGEISRAGE